MSEKTGMLAMKVKDGTLERAEMVCRHVVLTLTRAGALILAGEAEALAKALEEPTEEMAMNVLVRFLGDPTGYRLATNPVPKPGGKPMWLPARVGFMDDWVTVDVSKAYLIQELP